MQDKNNDLINELIDELQEYASFMSCHDDNASKDIVLSCVDIIRGVVLKNSS